MKRDLPGLRFGVEVVGLQYNHGVLWYELQHDMQRIFCLKCVRDGVPGLNGVVGLVAEETASGLTPLKP